MENEQANANTVRILTEALIMARQNYLLSGEHASAILKNALKNFGFDTPKPQQEKEKAVKEVA